MAFAHTIWFANGTHRNLSLPDDKLFQLFRRWIESDNTFQARGHVVVDGGVTLAINFANVAVMELGAQISITTPTTAIREPTMPRP